MIIFNFDSGDGFTAVDNKGMYFTTKVLWDTLHEMKKLPVSSVNPETVKNTKMRYYRLFEELDVSKQLDESMFFGMYAKMVELQVKSRTAQKNKIKYIKQID